MQERKHIAVYMRVSKTRQNIDNQRPELEKWVEANTSEDDIVVWYTEKTSATVGSQPVFEKLQTAVENGEVSDVICWRLDRLGRRVRKLSKFVDTLQRKGTRLVSMREGLDITTPIGRAMVTIIMALAELEAEILSERIKAGIERKQRQEAVRHNSWKKGVPKDKERKEAIKKMICEDGIPVRKAARIMRADFKNIYRWIREENWPYEYRVPLEERLRLGTLVKKKRQTLEKKQKVEPPTTTGKILKELNNLLDHDKTPISPPEED